MAHCLNSYYWAKEPLNEEVLYNSDDIIAEDSDIDESLQARADRNRRREAIGQRYLLGHIPFVQTASLRGPFGGKNGWAAPWGRNRACLNDKKPYRSTRIDIKDTNPQEEMDAEPETLAVEKTVEAFIQEDLLDRRIDDDALRYDADNEDDAFEEINDESHDLLHCVEHLDGTQTKHIPFSRDGPQSRNSNDDISNASDGDFKRVIKRNGSRDSMRGGNCFLQNERKRKVDTGWLRGANVLKRSRYELLEHSSPTPVAGTVHEGHRGLQSRSPPKTSGPKTLDGQENIQVLPIPNSGNPAAQLEAVNETNTLPVVVGGYDEISFDAMKDSTDAFLMPNGQIMAANYEGLIYFDLGLKNMNGLLHVSHESILKQSSGKQQEDVVQVSPSGVGVFKLRSPSSTRRLTRQRRSAPLKGDGKVSDKLFHGHSAPSDAIADEDFRHTPSPASEESFYYRKTSRKFQGRKASRYSEKGEETASDTGKFLGNPEREAQTMQPIDALPHHSSNPVSSGNARGFEIQKNTTNSCFTEDGKHQNRSKPSIGNLDLLSELDGTSSPDPLSEGFKDNHQQRITPDMNQGKIQNPANLSNEYTLAVDCQSIIASQFGPASHQQAGGTQQAQLRGLSQLSTSSISEHHIEMPIDCKGSMQCQLSGSSSQRSVLLAKAEHMDGPILTQGTLLDGRLSSQLESPELDTQPNFAHGLHRPDVSATQPIGFKDSTERSQPLDLGRRVSSSSDNTPTDVNAQVLDELSMSTQSPWTAIRVESLRSGLSSDPGPNDSECELDNCSARRYLEVMSMDQTEYATLSAGAGDQSRVDGEDREEVGDFEPFKSLFKHSGQFSDEPDQSRPCFPSTQTLVNAATANPWNSAFKKPRRRKSDKRVSFGPLPSDVAVAASDAASKPLERMGSPPPPAGTLRLTQLDDPFHHRLKATRDLEVTEESLTKFMNTPWDDILALKPRAKPPSSSPAVGAMAEAFIAADKQSLHEELDIKVKSMSTSTKPTELLLQPRVWTECEQAELGSSLPTDASFSIAPNGRVMAVSIEAQRYDAEDNLHAVIEDMGRFLEGWDVESELKKAKGRNFEGSSDCKALRKREYLSRISNR